MPLALRKKSWRAEVCLGLLTVGLTVLVVIPVLELWRAHLSVPFDYQADASFNAAVTKGILEHGWYQHNASLGAPFGQVLYDFPLGPENLHLLMLKALGLFSSDFGTVMNLYYLLTYPLTALSALLVLRSLRVSRPASLVFATLYALLPYHFMRSEVHLFLSGYYAVPLGVFLALRVLGDEPLFTRRTEGRGPASFLSERTVLTLLACLIVGSTGVYYAAFTVILLAAAAAVVAFRKRSISPGLPALMVLIAITGTVAVNLVPSLMYRRTHGPNPEVAARHAADSETFGLKVADLLLPRDGHRLGPFSDLTEEHRESSPVPSEEGQALGIVGSIGLLFLLGTALAAAAGEARGPATSPPQRRLAFLTMVALLVATVGGFSSLIASLLFTQIRSWNRMSVVIAFLSFASLALLIGRSRERAAPTRRVNVAIVPTLVGVFLVGVLDQTSPSSVPDYSRTAKVFRSDGAFVKAIEEQLPKKSMVFQLPVRPFPEAGPFGGMADYDHFRVYFHSRSIRWSYGGLRGREGDWQEQTDGQPADLLAARLAAVGFRGIEVDRAGYPDHARELETGLRRLLGPPLVSSDGRLSFFSLAAFTAELRDGHSVEELRALAGATLQPVNALWDDGFSPALPGATGRRRWAGHRAEIRLVNPGPSTRRVTVAMTLRSARPEASKVELRYPDGRTDVVAVTSAGVHFTHEFEVPSGASTLEMSTDAPEFPGPFAIPDVVPRLDVVEGALYDTPPAAFRPPPPG